MAVVVAMQPACGLCVGVLVSMLEQGRLSSLGNAVWHETDCCLEAREVQALADTPIPSWGRGARQVQCFIIATPQRVLQLSQLGAWGCCG